MVIRAIFPSVLAMSSVGTSVSSGVGARDITADLLQSKEKLEHSAIEAVPQETDRHDSSSSSPDAANDKPDSSTTPQGKAPEEETIVVDDAPSEVNTIVEDNASSEALSSSSASESSSESETSNDGSTADSDDVLVSNESTKSSEDDEKEKTPEENAVSAQEPPEEESKESQTLGEAPPVEKNESERTTSDDGNPRSASIVDESTYENIVKNKADSDATPQEESNENVKKKPSEKKTVGSSGEAETEKKSTETETEQKQSEETSNFKENVTVSEENATDSEENATDSVENATESEENATDSVEIATNAEEKDEKENSKKKKKERSKKKVVIKEKTVDEYFAEQEKAKENEERVKELLKTMIPSEQTEFLIEEQRRRMNETSSGIAHAGEHVDVEDPIAYVEKYLKSDYFKSIQAEQASTAVQSVRKQIAGIDQRADTQEFLAKQQQQSEAMAKSDQSFDVKYLKRMRKALHMDEKNRKARLLHKLMEKTGLQPSPLTVEASPGGSKKSAADSTKPTTNEFWEKILSLAKSYRENLWKLGVFFFAFVWSGSDYFYCDDFKTVLQVRKSVNDDYCDCEDGSDEPGSDACSGVDPRLRLKKIRYAEELRKKARDAKLDEEIRKNEANSEGSNAIDKDDTSEKQSLSKQEQRTKDSEFSVDLPDEPVESSGTNANGEELSLVEFLVNGDWKGALRLFLDYHVPSWHNDLIGWVQTTQWSFWRQWVGGTHNIEHRIESLAKGGKSPEASYVKDMVEEKGLAHNFECPNLGSFPKTVRAAVVGDGVCDCCDGSDEWRFPNAFATRNHPFCPNTCRKEGAILEEAMNDVYEMSWPDIGERNLKDGIYINEEGGYVADIPGLKNLIRLKIEENNNDPSKIPVTHVDLPPFHKAKINSRLVQTLEDQFEVHPQKYLTKELRQNNRWLLDASKEKVKGKEDLGLTELTIEQTSTIISKGEQFKQQLKDKLKRLISQSKKGVSKDASKKESAHSTHSTTATEDGNTVSKTEGTATFSDTGGNTVDRSSLSLSNAETLANIENTYWVPVYCAKSEEEIARNFPDLGEAKKKSGKYYREDGELASDDDEAEDLGDELLKPTTYVNPSCQIAGDCNAVCDISCRDPHHKFCIINGQKMQIEPPIFHDIPDQEEKKAAAFDHRQLASTYIIPHTDATSDKKVSSKTKAVDIQLKIVGFVQSGEAKSDSKTDSKGPHGESIIDTQITKHELALREYRRRYVFTSMALKRQTLLHGFHPQFNNNLWNDKLPALDTRILLILISSNWCVEKTLTEYMSTTSSPEQWNPKTYKICFGEKVTQWEKGKEKAVVLGHKPSLGFGDSAYREGKSTAYHVQGLNIPFFAFSGGDSCPGDIQRKVHVFLTCGKKVEIEAVTEPELCQYIITLTSPGGCGHIHFSRAQKAKLNLRYNGLNSVPFGRKMMRIQRIPPEMEPFPNMVKAGLSKPVSSIPHTTMQVNNIINALFNQAVIQYEPLRDARNLITFQVLQIKFWIPMMDKLGEWLEAAPGIAPKLTEKARHAYAALKGWGIYLVQTAHMAYADLME